MHCISLTEMELKKEQQEAEAIFKDEQLLEDDLVAKDQLLQENQETDEGSVVNGEGDLGPADSKKASSIMLPYQGNPLTIVKCMRNHRNPTKTMGVH